MLKPVTSALLLLGLVAPAGASAQDCMCLGWAEAPPPQPVQVEQSIEVGPVFSSDGETLLSPDAHAVQPGLVRVDEPAPTAPVEVLWCLSSNDPRCGSRDEAPNDGPQAYEAFHGAAPATSRPPLPRPDHARAPHASNDGSPRDEMRGRLERPPRA